MCEACRTASSNPWAVNLTRKGPKNKGKTPAEWLIGHDLQEGYYEIADRSPVYNEYDESVVGWIVEYNGANMREYSQGAFTLKSANDGCGQCESHLSVDEHGIAHGELDYHGEVKYANLGCQCGNIAYPSRDCVEHPLPSLESRWIKLQQAGNEFCNHCQARLVQESWDIEVRNYCNQQCRDDWKDAYERRMAEWKVRSGRR